MLHTNLRYALVVLLTAGCTQDFGAFRGGGGNSQGGSGQGGEGGSPPVCANDCNDSNPCTQDICDPDGNCLHPAEEDPPLTQVIGDCKDLSCDGTELVTAADTADIPADDNNPCTSEACDGDMPTHPFEPEGTACNDGVCNATGQCSDCDGPEDCGTDTQCATYACTNNTCETTYLAPLVISGDDDGDCMALQCADNEPDPQDLPYIDDVEDDGNVCSTDTCSAAGAPEHNPAGAGTPCDDQLYCNGTDTCGTGTVCSEHTGNPCTGGPDCNNACNEAGGGNCFNAAGSACNNAADTACTNPDTCNGAGVCNPNNAAAGTPCPDGVFCNGAEVCLANGTCGPSPGDPCLPLNTTDTNCAGSCNEGSGMCNGPDPNGTLCGSQANGPCSNPDSCQAGVCSPNNEAAGFPCPDANLCNGAEVCLANGTCGASPGNPCPGHNVILNTATSCEDSCNPATGACNALDMAGTPCNENLVGGNGTCTGMAMEPNCNNDGT